MANLGNKSNRLQILDSYFSKLLSKGYTQETYKDLNIFTKFENEKYYLSVYRGTSTKDLNNYCYRTLDRMQQVINNYKSNTDARQQYKENAKNNPTVSTHANTAKAIREELKKVFPSYKFSVTSKSFSGGDSVHISWTNGPTTKQVDSIVNKYQYGHFNGMEDIYEYSNNIEGLPQTKYVSTSREINPELKNRLLPEFEKLYKSDEPEYSRNSTVNTLHRILSNTEIKNADNVKGIKEIQQNGSFEDCFKLTYHKNEKETVQADTNPNIKPIESAAGEVNVIEYSEKAIAVIGDTKPIKELLKSLGGSFNPRLSCGPGWIFSKKKLEEVQSALLEYANKKENTEEAKKEILALPAHEETQSNQLAEIVQEVEAEILPILNDSTGKKVYILEYFKIIWHEGRHIEGAIFEGATFTDWQEVQKAFFKLWEVNEKGSDGGYTKVKCEIKLKGSDLITDRIDITNRIKNGDFNPSDMHIVEYISENLTDTEEPDGENLLRHSELEYRNPLNVCDSESGQYKEVLMEYEAQHPKKYDSLQEITAAANTGKQVSIYNLFSLIQETTQA